MKQLPLPLDMDEDIPHPFDLEIEAWKEEVPVIREKVVSVVLARHKIVNVTGKFTGRIYKFNGAGSIVDDVDIRDAELLVNLPLPPSCCGSYPTPQFQILGR
jgi:hypothetical protein